MAAVQETATLAASLVIDPKNTWNSLSPSQQGALAAGGATSVAGIFGLFGLGGRRATSGAPEISSNAVSKAEQAVINRTNGTLFNCVRGLKYEYNEVKVQNPLGRGYHYLDSYSPRTGEIVSRKFTQLADVGQKSAVWYIREAGDMTESCGWE